MKKISFHLGLIGYPLGHSLSPHIHQAALKAADLEGSYARFSIRPLPEGQLHLNEILARVRRNAIHGLNVTIPHKQTVLPLLDRVHPTAAAIGAVNTIGLSDGALTGWNTDAGGFMDDLQSLLPGTPGRALVLGAGGAARAVVFGLVQAGWRVTLAARDRRQAEILGSELGAAGITGLPPTPTETAALRPDLLVNATPVGMAPAHTATPWPEDLALPHECLVYDLVYNPRDTRLLTWAHREGLRAAGGLGMLVRQAAAAFQIWTGHPPPLEAMFSAAESALPTSQKDQF